MLACLERFQKKAQGFQLISSAINDKHLPHTTHITPLIHMITPPNINKRVIMDTATVYSGCEQRH